MALPEMHRLLFAALIPPLALLPCAQGAPAVTATPAASVKVESAGDTLPFTLQGFFGKPGAVEVSFRDKTTGATAWVKPGKSFSGWTVESVDTAKGTVVLAASGRHMLLQKAKEDEPSVEVSASRLKTKEESLVWKKFMELEKNPEVEKFFRDSLKEADRRVKEKHPEFDDENGKLRSPEPAGYMPTRIAEWKRVLLEEKTPSVVKAAPILGSIMDGFLQAGPYPKWTEENKNQHWDQIQLYELKAFEAADRIYLARYGKIDTAPVPPQAVESPERDLLVHDRDTNPLPNPLPPQAVKNGTNQPAE